MNNIYNSSIILNVKKIRNNKKDQIVTVILDGSFSYLSGDQQQDLKRYIERHDHFGVNYFYIGVKKQFKNTTHVILGYEC